MKFNILVLTLITVVLSCFAFGSDEYAEGYLLVKFQEGLTSSQRQQVLDNAGGGIIMHEFKYMPWCVIKLTPGCTVEGKLDDFNATPGIYKAEPNYKRYKARIPNDTMFSDLWGLENTGQTGGILGADISATRAWEYTTGSRDIVVAVTDTGVDYNHVDLNANMWVNTAELNGTNEVDDDGNGYIDDIYGWDSAGVDSENFDDADGDPMDADNHGTHVSGTVGAVGNNNTGVVGVNWQVSIMAIKIFADNSPFTFTSDQVAGIEYAIENGAHVMNASWGGFGFSQALYDVIDYAKSNGIIFVAAAGNHSSNNDLLPFYPASYDLDNIISVLSTTDTDDLSSFSNFGFASVDIGAPGSDILSTIPDGGYGLNSGTSMASPHVAGAAALVLSVDPGLNYQQIKDILLDTADVIPSLSGLCLSEARMNIEEALKFLLVDETAPLPDPSQWQTWGKPKATSPHHIAMEAVRANDIQSNVIEYHFECVTDGSFNSVWQTENYYQRSDFNPNSTYEFRVRTRDGNNNITDWSETASATTPLGPDDPCAPFPNPAQWLIKPKVIRLNPVPTIRMQAREALDENNSNIQYYFRCITDPNFDSGWQTSSLYTIQSSALVIGNSYTFGVRAKDDFNNETGETLATVTIGQGGQNVLTVPQPYATIQAAINAAAAGDIVVVSPGTYTGPGNRDIIFPGPAIPITVTSVDPNDPASTVINVQGSNNPLAPHRGFIFNAGETSTSVLDGFTIINGYYKGTLGANGTGPGPIPGPGTSAADGQPGGPAAGAGILCGVDPATGMGVPSSPLIRNCIIRNCIAEGGDGGNGSNDTTAGAAGGNGGNAGTASGGGIYIDNQSAPQIEGCQIIDCHAISGIPGQAASGNNGDATNPAGGFGGTGGSSGLAFGGGIYIDGSPGATSITNTMISECTVTALAGADGNDAGNGDINNGGPGGSGGAGGASLDVHGGGIACNSGTIVNITNCSIAGNSTISAAGGNGGLGGTGVTNGLDGAPGGGSVGLGGGFWNDAGCTVVMQGTGGNETTINGNFSDHDGGGLYLNSTTANNSMVTLTDCEISRNTSNNADGGGIWFHEGGTMSLTNCDIINNQAQSGSGGGVFTGDVAGTTILNMQHCEIRDNTVSSTIGFGGGMFINTANLNILDSRFENNTAFEGGGLWTFNCTVNDINDSRILSNTAIRAGGGLAFVNGNSNFNVNIKNSIFYDNNVIGSVEGTGGALFFQGANNNPHLVENCLIFDNSAFSSGGGISNNVSSWLILNNCTLSGNQVIGSQGAGGAVSCAEYWAYLQIENSILWSNQAAKGAQVAVGKPQGSFPYGNGPYADVESFYSDIEGGSSDVWIEDETQTFTAFWWLEGSIDIDPEFVEISIAPGDKYLNYHLSHIPAGQDVNSPCIDAGDPASTFDFNNLTTRTDSVADDNILDMGYHYFLDEVIPEYTLTIEVIAPNDFDPGGYLEANSANFDLIRAPNSIDVIAGTIVDLNAIPDINNGFAVSEWTGADNVPAIGERFNTVLMNSDKTVTVEFAPEGKVTLYTSVTTNNGKILYKIGSQDWDVHPGRTFHFPGVVVDLNVDPDPNSETFVTHWSNTDNDDSISRFNTVTMDGTKNVKVELLEPRKLYVPQDYTYIQDAINDAQAGDIVILAPNPTPYTGDDHRFIIDGKPITLTSIDPEDPDTVANTRLNKGLLILNVDRTCVIDGLTFENMSIHGAGGFDGGTTENPLADGENGFPQAGTGIRLHNYYLRGSFTGWTPPQEPQPGASPIIRNCVFSNLHVEGGDGGAGAAVDNASGDGGWGAWAHGGAISLGADSNPLIEDCVFENCSATGGNGGNGSDSPAGRGGLWTQSELGSFGWDYGPYEEFIKYSGFGGALFIDVNSVPEIKNCTFTGNMVYGGASGDGGGPVNPDAHWKIPRFGGAVYCADESAPIFINCTFINNEANETEPNIWDWNSWHSSAQAPASSYHDHISYGGAVAFEDSAEPTFENCTFENNRASIGGAVHSSWAYPEIYTCDFNSNSAGFGGAIVCIGGAGYIEECTFGGNAATTESGYGGALAILGANTDLKDCQILDNTADGSGGGVYISSRDIDNADVTDLSMVSLHNCLIAGNTAGFSGGGVASNWHAYTNLELCTIADNIIVGGESFGGGLCSSYGNFTKLTDCIVWNNAATNGSQIAVRPQSRPSAVVAKYSNIRGGSVFFQPPSLGGNIWVDTDNLYLSQDGIIGDALESDDPLFVSGLLGHYYLSQTATGEDGQGEDSPSVDAGSDTAYNRVMNKYTTRTDEAFDKGQVDMGFHYKLSDIAAVCKFCDLELDGIINMMDIAEFMEHWMRSDCSEDNDWCEGADLNFDHFVDMMDFAIISGCDGKEDTLAPIPDPPTWGIRPYSAGGGTIMMAADIARDAWWGVQTDDGVTRIEYEFVCVTDPNFNRDFNSPQSTDPNYMPDGFTTGMEYAFKYRVRDGKGNISRWSSIAGALVAGQIIPVSPDPMTWSVTPYATSATSISMEATTATGPDNIVYLFRDADSLQVLGQQADPVFEDTGLVTGLTYRYQCAAMNPVIGPSSITGWSSIEEATPTADVNAPDNEAPITPSTGTSKAAFASPPVETFTGGAFTHSMTAETATDESEPVLYRFYCNNDSRFSSGWQESPEYSVAVANNNSRAYWTWQVQTRDSADTPNTGLLSDKHDCNGNVIPFP